MGSDPKSFVERLGPRADSFVGRLQQQGAPIHFIRTYDAEARPCYFFLLASHERLAQLEADRAGGGMIDLTRYGTIVASGYGHEPERSTLDALKERYGYDWPFEASAEG